VSKDCAWRDVPQDTSFYILVLPLVLRDLLAFSIKRQNHVIFEPDNGLNHHRSPLVTGHPSRQEASRILLNDSCSGKTQKGIQHLAFMVAGSQILVRAYHYSYCVGHYSERDRLLNPRRHSAMYWRHTLYLGAIFYPG